MTRGRVLNTNKMKKIVLTIIAIFFLKASLLAQGYTVHFDGTNDYISTPIDADLQAMPSTTFSGWIKPTGASGWQVIFGMEDGDWDRTLFIDNGGLGLSMGATGSKWQTGASVNPGVWQHVVAVYDNGSMKFYLNGVQYTSSTSEGSHSSSGTFTIGANQNGGLNYYKGDIDDVALWNEALTAAEITALYNAGSGLNAAVNAGNYTSSSNLLGYWRMNEGTGSTLTDGSGNGNSGTLVNMASSNWHQAVSLVSKHGGVSSTNVNYVDDNGKVGDTFGTDNNGKLKNAHANNGLTSSTPGTSAKQIKTDYPSSSDGVYWITNPSINSGSPFQIYADMTTDGGGWMLLNIGGGSSAPTESSTVTSLTDRKYLPRATVIQLANLCTDVQLRSGNSATSYAYKTTSTHASAIGALRSSATSTHGAATWANGASSTFTPASGWSWNLSCGPSATGWPKMYHSCGNGGGVHWFANHPSSTSNGYGGKWTSPDAWFSTWIR